MSNPLTTNPQDPRPVEGGDRATFLQRQFQFAGPPPPGVLEYYDKICPGTAAKRIEAAHEEGLHRQSLENKTFDANVEAMRRQYALNSHIPAESVA